MDYYECENCGKSFDEFEMNYRAAQADKKFLCRACRREAADSIYEAVFWGARNASGILAKKAREWLLHVTGTGGDSEAHYWPKDCDTCGEIARFVEDWNPDRAKTSGKEKT